MKTLIASCSAIVVGVAQAQSGVQLYGVVDAFAQYLTAAESAHRLESGGLAASRLGFRGKEDLGGGLETFFVLEGGINLDEGTLSQGGAMFGRQSIAGLRSASLGSLSAGRHQGSLFSTTIEFSAFAAGNAGPSTSLIGGFGGYEPVRGSASSSTPGFGPVRVNNAVRYESPSWNGLRGSLLYGTGEVPGAVSRSRLVDLGGRYTSDHLDIIGSAVRDEVRDAAGLLTTRARTSALAATYRIGPWRALGGYIDFNDRRLADLDGQGAWLGVEYRIGKFTWKGQYVLNRPDRQVDADSKAFGIGLVYELSKRTALYGSIARFSNEGRAGAGGLGRFNSAVPAQLTTAGENDITELVTGIRHSF